MRAGSECLALFAEELLPQLLDLAADPVPNVRLAVCRLLRQGPPCRLAFDPGPAGVAGRSTADVTAEPDQGLWSAAGNTKRPVQRVDSPDREACAAEKEEGCIDACENTGAEGPHAGGAAPRVADAGCEHVRAWLLKQPGVAEALQQLDEDGDSGVRAMASQ